MKVNHGSKSTSLLPDFVAKDITTIDFSYLKKQGILACFFDLDHTMLHRGSHQVSEEILLHLRNMGMHLYIATNRRYTKRLEEVARQISARGIMHAAPGGVRKPAQDYYQQMVAMAGVLPERIVMIGDRLIQDVWGANRVGIRSVLVDKIGSIKWWDYLLIIPDLAIPLLYRRRFNDV